MSYCETRMLRKVGWFAIMAAMRLTSVEAAETQFSETRSKAFLSCLTLESPTSPSAASLAPLADGLGDVGSTARLRTLVVGGPRSMAQSAARREIQIAGFDYGSLQTTVDTPQPASGWGILGVSQFAREHRAEFQQGGSFELGFAVSLGSHGRSQRGAAPESLLSSSGIPSSPSRAGVNADRTSQLLTGFENASPSGGGVSGANVIVGAGITPLPNATPVTVTLPAAQPFAARILIQSRGARTSDR